MVKKALRRGAQWALMAQPHEVRFMGGSHAPHPLPNGHKAVESAKWLNAVERRRSKGVLAVVDGPAFTDLATLRDVWGEVRSVSKLVDPKLYRLIVALVAYGEREAFSEAVLRSPYYGLQLEDLPLALKAELETFLSQ